MAKAVHNSVLDGAFKVIKSAKSSLKLAVCTSQPTNITQALTTFKLASHALTASDFTIADGASSKGRKVTVAKQSSLSITGSTGSAQHVAVVDKTRVLLVTTCTKQSLTKGNKVNVPAFADTIGDPT